MLPRPYLVGLVGVGVGPSLTPTIHMLEARALGLDYVYRTVDLTAWGIPPSEIGTLLHYAAALGYDALNITHPCKQLVIEHLDRVAEQAARLGAVNTVLFSGGATTGYNTDQRGFATALATELPGAAKDVVVQLGAGGAGAAVADALLESGVEHHTRGGDRTMIYLLAAVVPPLGLLLNGQPFAAIFNLVLCVFCAILGGNHFVE